MTNEELAREHNQKDGRCGYPCFPTEPCMWCVKLAALLTQVQAEARLEVIQHLELCNCHYCVDRAALLRKYFALAETQTERRDLLQASLRGLRVLRAIGQSQAYKTVGKVEVPSWGKPVMETCDQLISKIEEFLLQTGRVIQSSVALEHQVSVTGQSKEESK